MAAVTSYEFKYHVHKQTGRFTVWSNGKKNTNKFYSGNVFTICTNHFLLPKNSRQSLKLVPKIGLNTNFPLEFSVREYRTTFSDVLVATGIFFLERQPCSMYFSNGFVGNLFVLS